MSKDFLGAMLAGRIGMGGGENKIRDTGSPERLRELGERYLAKHDMPPGSLVAWKPGMRNTKYPEYGKPGVVVEIVPGHRRDEGGSGAYAGENAELRIGVTDDEGDFICFWQDINRFEPYRED